MEKKMPWEWFAEKVLPGLFLAVAVAVGSTSIAIWQSVSELSSTVKNHEKQLESMRIELQSAKIAMVTRTELLETMKRVEQQMEIMLLRANVRGSRVEIK